MPVTAIATPAAVVAIITVAKDLGLPAKVSPLLAVTAGILLNLLDSAVSGVLTQHTVLAGVSQGLILGLSACGVYDIAKTVTDKRSETRTSE